MDRKTAPGLAVTQLTLTDFRNYRQMRLTAHDGPVVVVGDNGSGKTNLLEALSMLVPGRGMRRARLSEMTRHGAAAGWAVAAWVQTPDGLLQFGTGLESVPDNGSGEAIGEVSERRIVKVDGVKQAGPASLARNMRMIWLSPSMDRLLVDAPSARRHFLDGIVTSFQPEHMRHIAAYERAMRERLKLLKEGRWDDAWFNALEAQMAEHGVNIAAARREAVARLRGGIEAADGAFPKADLALQGILENGLEDHPAVEVEDQYRASLMARRTLDHDSGITNEGPHRTDLVVHYQPNGLPIGQCSTGEQKALLLGIVLAHARVLSAHFGAPPVVLLDEVTAHLDERRRRDLFDEIMDLGAQAWLSGTEIDHFRAIQNNAQFIAIHDGSLSDMSVTAQSSAMAR